MKYLFFIIACLLIVPTARAEDIKNLPVIKDMQSQGAAFSESFAIDEHLEGIISTYQGQTYPIYRVKNTDHLIYGDLHTVDGLNLTKEHIALYPTAVGEQPLWSDLSEATFIENGNATGKVIYSFIDTNCPYCKAQWHEMQPYLKQGLNVKYIPVGFLTKDSEKQAAYILGQNNPYQTLKAFEEGKRLPDNIDTTLLEAEAIRGVRKNTQLMKDLGIRATPASFYLGEDGMVYGVEGKFSSSLIQRLLE